MSDLLFPPILLLSTRSTPQFQPTTSPSPRVTAHYSRITVNTGHKASRYRNLVRVTHWICISVFFAKCAEGTLTRLTRERGRDVPRKVAAEARLYRCFFQYRHGDTLFGRSMTPQ